MSEPRKLVLVGAGGFARETAAAVRAVNETHPTWALLGYLDDDPAMWGRRLADVPVLGPIGSAHRYPDASIVLCTGRPDDYFSRARISTLLDVPSRRYATIIHPLASVSADSAVGPGSVLLAGAVLTANCHVGSHVTVMPGAVLTHDDVLGDYVTLGARVCLGGGARVDRGAYLGSGVLVREGLSVGAWSMIGMGAVVLADVPAAEIWYGVPARCRGTVDVPGALVGV